MSGRIWLCQHELCALFQALAQNGMLPKAKRLRRRVEAIVLGDGTVAQALELGKDEPHPVAGLFAERQFVAHRFIDAVLRLHKSLEALLCWQVHHFIHSRNMKYWRQVRSPCNSMPLELLS